MLEEGGQEAGPGPGLVCHPGHHGLVDLTLRADQQLVAGDQSGDLVPAEGAEVLALDRHLLEMLEDELLGRDMKVPGTHETRVQVHRHRITFVNPEILDTFNFHRMYPLTLWTNLSLMN